MLNRHDYPYTDFHELNLDWFLNKFSDLLSEWAKMQGDFANLEEAVESLKEYVRTYIDDLDIQEEINNKIDDLVASGEFENMINLFNSHIRDTYGTYETATVDNVRNNDQPVNVNGLSDAAMAGYNFWDSVTRYTGYTIIPDSSGVRFTPSNCTLTECYYDFIDDSFVPLIDRVVFLFSVYNPTNLSDCYYGRITSIDRLDRKFYVEKWYKHGDTSGNGYIPDASVYQYGIYNLKTHAYGDVCDIKVNANGDPVLGTVSGRQTNLWLNKDMLNNVTMDDTVIRAYDSNVNVTGYSVRTEIANVPIIAFYGRNVATLLGSNTCPRIFSGDGELYSTRIVSGNSPDFPIFTTAGGTVNLDDYSDYSRWIRVYNNSDSNCTVRVTNTTNYAIRMFGQIFSTMTLLPHSMAEIFFDKNTGNFNTYMSNIQKIVGYGNTSPVVRVNTNFVLNVANIAPYEIKYLINNTSTDHTVTINETQYTIPANSYKLLFYDNNTYKVM